MLLTADQIVSQCFLYHQKRRRIADANRLLLPTVCVTSFGRLDEWACVRPSVRLSHTGSPPLNVYPLASIHIFIVQCISNSTPSLCLCLLLPFHFLCNPSHGPSIHPLVRLRCVRLLVLLLSRSTSFVDKEQLNEVPSVMCEKTLFALVVIIYLVFARQQLFFFFSQSATAADHVRSSRQ